MVKDVEVLAIIPARGGSKSLPRKNIRSFAGHPLLAYSVAAGLEASSVDRVIVSTEDEETARISKAYGAEVPFMRPNELALDSTPDLPVFRHALAWLAEREGYHADIIVQLRPTTPLRPPGSIDRGVTMLRQHPEADSVRAVVPSGQNPFKMWRITEEGRMESLLESGITEAYNRPRQELPPTYWQTGHVDIFWRSTLIEKNSMTGDHILPLMMDPSYTVDIDTELDWERAEWHLVRGDLDIVRPGKLSRPLPEKVELVVLDFDGVMTDNRVWTDAEGRESVAANRGDGWGLARLRERGIRVVVLSTEVNPVVAARCRKLNLEVFQGVEEKAEVLRGLLQGEGISPENTLYLGNDVNDVPCFSIVSCALVVADAHPDARQKADLVLQRKGGHGAVRELSDILLRRYRTE
jgi:N-acylneuraminate cytidylyltransferase